MQEHPFCVILSIISLLEMFRHSMDPGGLKSLCDNNNLDLCNTIYPGIMQIPPRENRNDLYAILNWFRQD